MINRELIRIKIVQLTYAYYQNGNKLMDSAEKELLFSLSKAYDLYNYLLELIVAVTQEERRRVEVATQRAISLQYSLRKTVSCSTLLRHRSSRGLTVWSLYARSATR